MTRARSLALTLATTALVALSPLAMAQDQGGTNLDTGAAAANGAVSNLALAQSVYDYGVASGDALAVLTAARLMATVEVVDADRTAETRPTEGMEPSDAEGSGDGPVDVPAMVAKARELAGDNEAILGLIADFEAEGARGRIGGPSRTLSRLRGGYTDVWTIPFYGGLLAEVAVLGDGDSDLDVIITDENGNTICVDRSFSDKVYCSWTPRWNGYFYVTVMNMGRVRNSYYLLTN
jgi:hypothetical protein